METKAAKARLRETLAELEVLPEAADESSPSTARNRAPGEHRSRPPMHESRSDAANATHAGNGRPTGDATLACWNSINDVIAREAAIRIAPANLTAANASGFVDARLQAGRFAADALRRLSSEQVDPELLAHSQALAEWYDEEARLAGEASALLASSDVAARRGSAGNSWRTAEERHRARCDEINRRSTVLQSQLSHRYNEPFPPMK
jgi:hypothetical protein